MRKVVLLSIVLFLWNIASGQQNQSISGVIHIKVTPEMAELLESKSDETKNTIRSSTGQAVVTGLKSFDNLLSEVQATKMKRLFPYHPKYEKRQQQAGLHLWYVVDVDDGIKPQYVSQKFKSDLNIISVEQVKPPVLHWNKKQDGEPPVNDPELSRQWHYNNTGQTGGLPGADMNLFAAWLKQMKADNVIVAVIDGGVDVNHPDLIDNLWVNEAELNGTEGEDDDGNGYVDDIHGYNFIRNDGNIIPHFHGTHVAGTVAASNNNGEGVAGVAGGTGNKDGARLMALQIFSDIQSATNYAPPFVYAANNGAVIAQCSWGWQYPGWDDDYQSTLDAIDYFIEWAGKDENGNPLPGTPMAGGIVIFSSGNQGEDDEYWPGYYSKVLTVGATNQFNRVANYSNYGEWVDIMAPGGSSEISVNSQVYSTYLNNGYGYLEGTSMASPHVAGVAALILAKFGSETYTPDMLKTRLQLTTTDIRDLNPNFVNYMGAGLLNAGNALQDNTGEAPDKITDLKSVLISHNFIDFEFTAPEDNDNDNAYSYEIRYSQNPNITSENIENLPFVTKRAKEAGNLDTLRISGLEAHTDYYFVIRSFDIWSNQSELSDVLNVKTLGNAQIEVSPLDTISIEIDVTQNPVKSTQIKVANVAEESVIEYHMQHIVSKDPRPIPDVEIAKIVMYEVLDEIAPDSRVGSEGTFLNPDSKEFIAASNMVVDVDTFTLTHVKAAIMTVKILGVLADESFQISIVKGGKNNPSEGTVIYNKFFDYKSLSTDDYLFDLEEQILFTKGESFWVVFTFPPEYYTPMGADTGIEVSWGENVFSEDGGETWTKFADANAENGYLFAQIPVFRIFSYSKQQVMQQFVTFNPESGFVPAGMSENVTVTFDANNIIIGEYQTKIRVLNDDADNNVVDVPVKLTVTGHRPQYYVPTDDVSLGLVFVGASKVEEFEIENKGLGDLEINKFESSHNVFTVSPSNLVIPPQQKRKVKITYTPVNTESLMAKLVIKTNEGDKIVSLQGAGINPPVIKATPNELEFNGVVGDKATREFYIKNDGPYKLNYDMNRSGAEWYDNFTGYEAKKSAINWEADMSDAEGFYDVGLSVRDLGFKFNYYGEFYDKITIGSRGYIFVGEQNEFKPNMQLMARDFEFGDNPITGAIAPLWLDIRMTYGEVPLPVSYKKFQDYVVLEWLDVGMPAMFNNEGEIFQNESAKVDMQLAIFSNGTMEFRYRNYRTESAWGDIYDPYVLWYHSLIGFESRYHNEETMDGIVISQNNEEGFMQVGDEFTVSIQPGYRVIKKIDPISGSVMPGDSVKITVDLEADMDLMGNYYEDIISIQSNDPINPSASVKIKSTITAVSLPAVDTTNLDFGEVNYNYSSEKTLTVSNEGGEPFSILSATVNAPFTVTPRVSSNICGGYSSLQYIVNFSPVAAIEKEYLDTVVFRTDLTGDKEYLRVVVKGSSILNPEVQIEPISIDLTMNSGSVLDTAVIIKNIGDADLLFNVSSWDSWFTLDGSTQTEQYTLSPGGSRRIDVKIDAKELYDGGFPQMATLFVNSNAPINEGTFDYTIFINIIGQPNINAVNDTVNFGTVYYFEREGEVGIYQNTFTLINEGTSVSTIDSIKFSEGFDFVEPFMYELIEYGLTIEAKFEWPFDIKYTPSVVPENNKINGYALVYADGSTTPKEVKLLANLYHAPIVEVAEKMANKLYSVKVLPGADPVKELFDIRNIGRSNLNYNWEIEYMEKQNFDLIRPASGLKAAKANASKTKNRAKVEIPTLRAYEVEQTSTIKSAQKSGSEYNFVDSVQYIYCTDGSDVGLDEEGRHLWNTAIQLTVPLDSRYATRFKTGNSGMNISHVANWYKSVYEETMEIKILLGHEYEGAREIYSELITTRTSETPYGNIEINELANQVHIGPNEYFWVVYRHFSTTIFTTLWSYWSFNEDRAIKMTEEFVIQLADDEIYLIGMDFDQFYLKGYFMGAYAVDESNDGSWLGLTPDKGDIEADGSHELTLQLNAPEKGTYMTDRFARVNLTTNDPLQEDITIYVEMLMNGVPKIHYGENEKGISDSRVTVAVNENTNQGTYLKVIDPDGDEVTLDYQYISGSGGIAPTVGLEDKGDGLYLFTISTEYGSAGLYVYEFTATDDNGLSSKSQLSLVVQKTYRIPQAVNLPDVEVQQKNTLEINLNDAFTNPDNSPMSYTVSAVDDNVATLYLESGNKLTIYGATVGSTKVEVNVVTAQNLSIDTAFMVTVTHRAPLAVDLNDVVVKARESVVINLNNAFTDPDGGAITYSVSSEDESIAVVTLAEQQLTVTGVSVGTAIITVEAKNVNDAVTVASFNAQVISADDMASTGELIVYPNPATNYINLTSRLIETGNVEVRIYSTNGALMFRKSYGNVTVLEDTIDISSLPAGIYLVQYLVNDKKIETKRFIK